MAKLYERYNEDIDGYEYVSRMGVLPDGTEYREYRMEDGSYGDREIINKPGRRLIDGSSYSYDVQYREPDGEGVTGRAAYGTLEGPRSFQESVFSSVDEEMPYWRSGTVLTQDEVAQMLPLIMNSGYVKDAPTSAEAYFNDPRSSIKIENGQFVYRPDQAQGDWTSTIGGNLGIGNAFKGWVSSPGTGLVLAPFTGGTSMYSNLGRVAGLAAQSTGNENLSTLGTLLSLGGGVENLMDNWDSIKDSVSNFDPSKLNPFSGDAIEGSYDTTTNYGPSTNAFSTPGTTGTPTVDLSQPWTVDDMIRVFSQDGQAITGNLPSFEGSSALPLGGITSLLQGTNSTVPGPLGDLTLNPSGALLPAGVNLANSTQTSVPGLGSDTSGGDWIDKILNGAKSLIPGGLDSVLKGGSTALGGVLNYQAGKDNLDFAKQLYGDTQFMRDYNKELYTNPLGAMDRELGGALQRSWDIGMRKGSATGGNPMRNPAVMQQILQETQDQLITPYLMNSRQISSKGFANPGDVLGQITQATQNKTNALGQIFGGLVYPFTKP